MAKTQTFGDKVGKKAEAQKMTVKVVRGFKGPAGTIKFKDRLVQVEDLGQIDKMDFNG